MSDDQFYTVKHAAEYLGVSSGTIRRWDSGGKLVAQRHPVNRYRVYHVKDLEEIGSFHETAKVVNSLRVSTAGTTR
jgi:excisionase family DNA binding protein